MLSSNHNLPSYTKLYIYTVLNKEDWQSMKYESPPFVFVYKAYNSTEYIRLAKHEKSYESHSKRHFITQYISSRGTAVNEFY